jgi:hypothetical protein
LPSTGGPAAGSDQHGRPAAGQPGLVYAPADGIVTRVEDGIEVAWLPAAAYLRISIFLVLRGAQVARSPAGGSLLGWFWDGGECEAALCPHPSPKSRQARLVIQAGDEVIGLVLAASPPDRWIGVQAHPGDRLTAGAGVGLMCSGVHAEVLLPAGRYRPLAGLCTRLFAGQTPIARRAQE